MKIESGQVRPKWLISSGSDLAATSRLICFPYGGGGASIYRGWQSALGETVDVCAVQLPGRESRFAETACTDIDALLEAMLPELLPLFDRPVFLFGYSMGAAIAYKLAAYCRVNGIAVDLRGLICCARKAPDRQPGQDALAHLTDEEFLLHIVSLDGKAESLFQNEGLRAIALRLLRADFLLSASVVEPDDGVLDVPLTAIGGTSDPTVSLDQLDAWRRLTRGPYTRLTLPGGHFFMNDNLDDFMNILRDVVDAKREALSQS
ncbi:thioesterase II family protein [Burkholderia alba]|uniref:thioesterase II family protein n=1 Tax=Burkholderia alba TaxID=2683677 RepID=UPI002B057284|nr:alpha/beta fold hydrolase [Burkholderia alba]